MALVAEWAWAADRWAAVHLALAELADRWAAVHLALAAWVAERKVQAGLAPVVAAVKSWLLQ